MPPAQGDPERFARTIPTRPAGGGRSNGRWRRARIGDRDGHRGATHADRRRRTGSTAASWLADALPAQALDRAHALLCGPAGAGRKGLLLAQRWLCEGPGARGATGVVQQPCGHCASCHLVRTRVHPDLLVVVPDALRVALGWADEDGIASKSEAKPSRDVRVEQVRQAIAWSQQTSGRGRGKFLMLHPADALNGPAANALLKTLEDPGAFTWCSPASTPRCCPRCAALPAPAAGPARRPATTAGCRRDSGALLATGGSPMEARPGGRSIDPPGWPGPHRGRGAQPLVGDRSRGCGLLMLAHDVMAVSVRRATFRQPGWPGRRPGGLAGAGAHGATRTICGTRPWDRIARAPRCMAGRLPATTPPGFATRRVSIPLSVLRRHVARPSVIQLVFREKGALYAAYIPLLTDGGLFVPTQKPYRLGEDIYLLLSLPDDPQRYPVAGKVAWITPANASGGRTQGVGVRFPADDKTRLLKLKIEEILGTRSSSRPTQTSDEAASEAAAKVAYCHPMFVDSLPPHFRIARPHRRDPRRNCGHVSGRCASARRSRSSRPCTHWRRVTTTCGPAPACTPTAKACVSRRWPT
jgi:type IV pilus assembly protein PilZ